jgi:hypothetical protein
MCSTLFAISSGIVSGGVGGIISDFCDIDAPERPMCESMRLAQNLTQAEKRLSTIIKNALRTLREVFYGMTVYDWVHELEKARGEKDRLFTLIVYGDLLGVPILPPYYSLRLLPFLVPTIENWRRSMLRERDLTDLIDQEIG